MVLSDFGGFIQLFMNILSSFEDTFYIRLKICRNREQDDDFFFRFHIFRMKAMNVFLSSYWKLVFIMPFIFRKWATQVDIILYWRNF